MYLFYVKANNADKAVDHAMDYIAPEWHGIVYPVGVYWLNGNVAILEKYADVPKDIDALNKMFNFNPMSECLKKLPEVYNRLMSKNNISNDDVIELNKLTEWMLVATDGNHDVRRFANIGGLDLPKASLLVDYGYNAIVYMEKCS